jgi:hypothetical protein
MGSYHKSVQFYDIMRHFDEHFHNFPTEFVENFLGNFPANYF